MLTSRVSLSAAAIRNATETNTANAADTGAAYRTGERERYLPKIRAIPLPRKNSPGLILSPTTGSLLTRAGRNERSHLPRCTAFAFL